MFAQRQKPSEVNIQETAIEALKSGEVGKALKILQPLFADVPFSIVLRACIIEAVNRIARIEANRGEISRFERSALAPPAQRYQDFIDQLLYRMADLTEPESRGLEERLAEML